ncbi:hypothetical protein CONLIGDRAFT_693807 [Coniochaeta ligniaria NRRL 30616]|uniref:Uncharacterized protein n=1 Tax=Coniochaeta ligniaria NRRL 30616 TaxID=1408157 RepID=A0A1J7I797_9PEZI|nr:hypothetical protein CONLIGDRAFT_693807 [Coniochaeta ligniaria NRRL 30616]
MPDCRLFHPQRLTLNCPTDLKRRICSETVDDHNASTAVRLSTSLRDTNTDDEGTTRGANPERYAIPQADSKSVSTPTLRVNASMPSGAATSASLPHERDSADRVSGQIDDLTIKILMRHAASSATTSTPTMASADVAAPHASKCNENDVVFDILSPRTTWMESDE